LPRAPLVSVIIRKCSPHEWPQISCHTASFTAYAYRCLRDSAERRLQRRRGGSACLAWCSLSPHPHGLPLPPLSSHRRRPLRARSWEALVEEEDEEQEATTVGWWLCLPPTFSALEEGGVRGTTSLL